MMSALPQGAEVSPNPPGTGAAAMASPRHRHERRVRSFCWKPRSGLWLRLHQLRRRRWHLQVADGTLRATMNRHNVQSDSSMRGSFKPLGDNQHGIARENPGVRSAGTRYDCGEVIQL